MNNAVEYKNVKLFCRICFELKDDLKSVHTVFIAGECRMTIQDILKLISQEDDDNPNYPLGVCSDCRSLVSAVVILKEKFEKSTQILRRTIEQCQNTKNKLLISISGENGAQRPQIKLLIKDEIEGDKNENNDETGIDRKNGANTYKKDVKKEKAEGNSTENFHKNDVQDKNKTEIDDGNHTEDELADNDVRNVSEDQDETKEKVVQRKITASQDQFKHVCPICQEGFANAVHLRKHAREHKILRKYLKGKKVPNRAVFVAQSRQTVRMFKVPNITHQCAYCSQELSIEDFKPHMLEHRKQQNIKCNQCPRVFRRHGDLKIHTAKSHMGVYPYRCEYCNLGFVIENNYKYHKLKHTEKELPFKCKFCERTFANPRHLHRHSLIHTENITYAKKYRMARCKSCKSSFRSREELLEHRKRACVNLRGRSVGHPDGMSYDCPLCSKNFRVLESMNLHIRQVHKEESKQNANSLCSICGRCVANIYTHMATHLDTKPFKCDLCAKSFVTNSLLRKHILVHTGEKPFVCCKCGKAFNNVYNLQVHERIHNGDKRYVCNICDKAFLEKSYLKKHIKTHCFVKD